MKLQLKRLISLGLSCTLLFTSLNTYIISASEKDAEYLVMKSISDGGYDISTTEMTSVEADELRNVDGVAVVEKNGTVTGSEMSFSNDVNDFSQMEEILDDKDAHEMNIEQREVNNTEEWNMQQISADTVNQQDYTNTATGSAIKVCIIDSGVDYNSDTDVYIRKNFIPGQDDISIIYEDLCGHGTNVAGIIVAKDNNEGITGINSNILLYSAKVLDADCTAPVSRVVEAIYWAINQGVNIINISFGTKTESAALKTAIEDANNAGILIIAAAGNNGSVEYPAAYDEVMAIGSVDSEGQVSDFSPSNDKIELVAPGELIKSTGDFGGVSVHSGTSMSTPHITGVASVLWQKDPSVSASCIRALLDASANLYSNSNAYGYGLVDLDYALEIYDDFKSTYVQASASDEGLVNNNEMDATIACVSDNPSNVLVFDDIPYVEGSWTYTTHEGYVISTTNLTAANLKAIKAGATANDRYIGGMGSNPQWHGYYRKITTSGTTVNTVYSSNYMASYIYLTEIAQKWTDNTSTTLISYTDPSMPNYMTSDDYLALSGVVTQTGFNGEAWSTALMVYSTKAKLAVNNSNIRFYLYGVALHSVTDLFAHSSFTTDGNYINHTAGTNDWNNKADTTTYLTSRNKCASYMAKLVLGHAASDEAGSISDFYNVANNSAYKSTFYLKSYVVNAKAIDSVYYTNNSTPFNNIDTNVYE